MTQLTRCPRPDFALVRVAGADARSFLHAQTTQRIEDIGPDEFRSAAWLSPKGRVQALFDVIPDGNVFWLPTAADNAAWLADRLRIFVLRASVEIGLIPEYAVWSMTGDVSAWLLRHGSEQPTGTIARRDGLLWYRLSASLVNFIGTPGKLAEFLADVPPGSAETAVAAEIDAGRAEVTATLRDRYTAHMLNLDRLGAIAFDKGCYPGQEIVARTENLGQAKRRLFHFRAAGSSGPAPGDEIRDADDRPVGEVVSVARLPERCEFQAVVQAAAADGELTLANDERALELVSSANRG